MKGTKVTKNPTGTKQPAGTKGATPAGPGTRQPGGTASKLSTMILSFNYFYIGKNSKEAFIKKL